MRSMSKAGPIIVIDDDPEDHLILDEIFKNLNYPNKVIFFSDGQDAVEYLNATEDVPFLIISDINMPGMNGFELRNRIRGNERSGAKNVPYLFFSTSADKKAVAQAFDLSVQGYFIKPATMSELERTIKKIIEYWKESYAPSYFN
jgi:CheY-like chemotaxis protein